MIAYIKGVLAEKEPMRAVVEASGVGYELFISLFTYDALPATGETVKLYASHIVREDGQFLYGFSAPEEKSMFIRLTSVSGVGPKVAVSVLSGLTLSELSLAIASGDAKRISSIKGVGKKTAEKICIELKDKVSALEAFASSGAKAHNGKAFIKDAIMALSALGFGEEAAAKMVTQALAAEPSISDAESAIKKALSSAR